MKLRFGAHFLDLDRLSLHGSQGPIELRRKSFQVLRHLVDNAGRTVTKEELIQAVWPDVIVTDESVARCISDVRQALGDQGREVIRTVARHGYLLDAPVTREETTAAATTPHPIVPDRAAIAVLAFANLSNDPGQDYLGEGVADDILTELSRFPELLVIARNSSFRYKGHNTDVRQIGRELDVGYVLEGSIQRRNDSVRVTAQLIDAGTGGHLWAEHFNPRLSEIFAIQDEITRSIASTLAAHIQNAEARRALSKPPASWDAYDHFLRGHHALSRLLTGGSVEELHRTRALLERAIELDPGYARAYAALATSHAVGWINPVNAEYMSPDALQRAFDLAQKAVGLEPTLPAAHQALANLLLFRGEHDGCLAAWDKVFALNPNFCDWRYAHSLVLLGRPEEGRAEIRRHMRLDPFYPPLSLMVEGVSYLVQRRFAEAVPPFREMIMRAAGFRNGRLLLAATYAHLGREHDAREQIESVLELEPDCSLTKLAGHRYFQLPEHRAIVTEGLRKAGLPE
jgi:adenylate cyclase